MSAAAGWYADPAQPDRWRWYDGTAWTDHVSTPAQPDPAPVAAAEPVHAAPPQPAFVAPAAPAYAAAPRPAYPGAPAYSSTQPFAAGAFAAATVPAGGQDWRGVPKSPRTTPARLLVIVCCTVAGLFGVSVLLGGVAAGLRAMNRPSVAAGPTLIMDREPPASIAGLPPSDDATVVAALEKMRQELDAADRGLAGVHPTRVQGYAVRGQAVALLAWVRDDQPLDQAAVIKGVKLGVAEENQSQPLTIAEADGATMVCAASQAGNGVPTSSCTWVRSGTGLVTLAWAGSGDTQALAATTRETVRALVRTAT